MVRHAPDEAGAGGDTASHLRCCQRINISLAACRSRQEPEREASVYQRDVACVVVPGKLPEIWDINENLKTDHNEERTHKLFSFGQIRLRLP